MCNVTILLATYNGEKYIHELLESLNEQTYKDWECLIHDDGSTDNTVEIIDNFILSNSQKFKRLSYPATGSPQDNFTSLIKFSKSSYTMFCDQDDVWMPNKIDSTLKVMLSQQTAYRPTLVFTDLKVVDEKLNTISTSYLSMTRRSGKDIALKNLLFTNVAAGCTIMFNKPLQQIALANAEILKIAMHDWGLMLLCAITGDIKFLNSATVLYRQHNDNQVGTHVETFGKKISMIVKGNKIRLIKRNIDLQREFARLLVSVKSNTENIFLKDLSTIENQTKINRIKFYRSNGFYRNSIRGLVRLLIV